MKLLNKDEIMRLCDGLTVNGLTLIGNYNEQPTKTGKTFLGGNLNIGESFPFKVWQGDCFNLMKETDFSGKICEVSATVNEYSGTKSLILNGIRAIKDSEAKRLGLAKADFFTPKYNAEVLFNVLSSTVEKNTSENAFKVYQLVMSDIEDKVKTEFAAINHHDNCVSGLVAHLTKVTKAATLLKNYSALFNRISPDVLFVGCALHDIGKVVEYDLGVISDTGKKVSHLTIGCIMLEKHRKEIVDLMGTDYYLSLLSVISQHHGEYGDRPRTLAAYVINQIDYLDSVLTSLNELVDTAGDSQVSFDSLKLS